MAIEPAPCSFITFNLFSDLPTFRHLDRRLEIAAHAIAKERPGVVALQEIIRAHQSGDIGRKLCESVNRYCNGKNTSCTTHKPTDLGRGNGDSMRASR